MRGRLDIREIEDLPSDVLNAAEAKALASGNPLLLERSIAINELGRLERLERAWHRNQSALHATRTGLEHRADQLTANIAAYTRAAGHAADLTGDNFTMTVRGAIFTSRNVAAHAIAEWGRIADIHYARPHDDRPRGLVGEISGFPIHARTRSIMGNVVVEFQLEGIPEADVRVTPDQLLDGANIGVVRQLENRVSGLDTLTERARQQLEEHQRSLEDASRSLGSSFTHSAALQTARDALATIDAQLTDPAPAAEPAPVPPQPRLTQDYPHTGPHNPTPAHDQAGWQL